MAFIDVRDPHNQKLLFRFDPERDLVEIRIRGVTTLIDLAQYRQPEEDQPRAPVQALVALN